MVRVWTVAIDRVLEADRCLNWLSADERLKHTRFATEELKKEYALTRALSRWALSQEVPSVAPSEWRFERTDAGKPFVRGGPHFSLANAGNLVVCAVSREHHVGVDVEPRLSFAPNKGAFSRLEREVIDRVPERASDLWTLKEAYLKARGEGISVQPHRVGFVLDDHATGGRDDGVLAAFEDGENLDHDAPSWSLLLYRREEHAIAVAVRCAALSRESIFIEPAMILF